MERDFDTLIEAINYLKKKEGYIYDFNLDEDCIACRDIKKKYDANSFEVDTVYRFEGDSNPSDNSILYAITTKYGEKGLLVDGYGISSGQVPKEIMDKLGMGNREHS